MKAARIPVTTCTRYGRFPRRQMELPYQPGRDFRLDSVFGDLDPALAHGVDDGLGAVVDGELAEDGAHVVLDGLLADAQRVGHLLVRHALRDVVEDLDLAR